MRESCSSLPPGCCLRAHHTLVLRESGEQEPPFSGIRGIMLKLCSDLFHLTGPPPVLLSVEDGT